MKENVKVKGADFATKAVVKHSEDDFVKHYKGRTVFADRKDEESLLREVHKQCTVEAQTATVQTPTPKKEKGDNSQK